MMPGVAVGFNFQLNFCQTDGMYRWHESRAEVVLLPVEIALCVRDDSEEFLFKWS